MSVGIRKPGDQEKPMKLTPDQLAQYDRDGYLHFPEFFAKDEVEAMRREVARVATIDTEMVVREGTSKVPKIMFRMHEADGPTASAVMHAAVRLRCWNACTRCGATAPRFTTFRAITIDRSASSWVWRCRAWRSSCCGTRTSTSTTPR